MEDQYPTIMMPCWSSQISDRMLICHMLFVDVSLFELNINEIIKFTNYQSRVS